MTPVDSTEDGNDPGPTPWRRPPPPKRGLNRVPTGVGVGVLVALLVLSLGVVSVRVPASTATATAPLPTASATPVLSLRRSLATISRLDADADLDASLAALVAELPDDTCLTVEVGGLTFSHRADDAQAPASIQKLFTGTAALLELGADARYVTEVRADAVAAGVVDGDVYFVGSGDPLLSTAAYAARFPNQPQIFSDVGALADAIVAGGVTEIRGSVVGDESRYDAERYNPLWPQRFIAQDQIGPLSALTVNDGFAQFPATGISGLDPTADPPTYAASVLTDELAARGVTVVGAPAAGTAPPSAETVIGTHESPTVGEIVTQMLQESDNVTAELLARELGVRRGGAGTTAAGVAAVTAILSEGGLDTGALTVADGSGLAIEDSVSCDLVDAVLDLDRTGPVLGDSLSVVGVNGTLAPRWTDTDLVGAVRAKTGTLNQVASLAGYATTTTGDEAQFVLIVNSEAPTVLPASILDRQREMLETLVAYPDLVDLSSLAPMVAPG